MSQNNVQRPYKDSLFRMIFREKKELLSLYNAINQSDYQNPEELEVNVLEDVIYMGMKNDVSFIIGDYMNLYEAQSTWNPNMPLRGVFYFSQLYQGYVAEKGFDIYGKTQIPLPVPQYIVFYNGVGMREERKQVRLSDSFRENGKQDPALECVATYLNINYGYNKEIMSQCRKLYEYAYLIEEIRKHLREGYRLEAAVEYAIDYCIEQDILADFLRRRRAEVTMNLLTEYDEELHIRCEKELSFQEGKEIGRQEGIEKGIGNMIEVLCDLNIETEEICHKLIEKYQITQQQAEEFMVKYLK